jgi:hypothetical protein
VPHVDATTDCILNLGVVYTHPDREPKATSQAQNLLTPPREKANELCVMQIDFYFSDSNLPFDKFLFEQTNESKDGCASNPFLPLAYLLWVSFCRAFRHHFVHQVGLI